MDLTRLPLRILRLTNFSLAATLLFTLACTDDPTPAPRTDRTQQDLQQALSDLNQTLRSTPDAPAAEPTPTPNHQIADSTRKPSLPPATAILLPSGPGICGRSPVIQHAILKTLQMSSCSAVSNAELYRITTLTGLPPGSDDTPSTELRPDDLAGLVNLNRLTLSGNYTLPAATFLGAGVTELHIKDAPLSQAAFDGLLRLERLTLEGNYTLPSSVFAGTTIEHISLKGITLPPDTFDGMTSLKSLHYESLAAPRYEDSSNRLTPPLDEFPPLQADALNSLQELKLTFANRIPDLTGTELSHLTAIKQIGIYGRVSGQQNDPYRDSSQHRDYHVPEALFHNNPNLRSVHINISTGRTSNGDEWDILYAPRNLVAHLEQLESLSINSFYIEDDQPGSGPLALAPGSPYQPT